MLASLSTAGSLGTCRQRSPLSFYIDADLLTNTDVSWRGRAAILVSVETFNAVATVEEI